MKIPIYLRSPILVLLGLVPAAAALAHPGVGMVEDSAGNVFYTDLAQVWRIVLAVTPAGSTRVVARSPSLWAAYGGMIGRNGARWLLETPVINAVRVRRIDKDGKERVF